MAQHVGAASSALFAEQAEASVADKTVPKNAARASRRLPGMRQARNMAGPRLRKVSAITTCTTILTSLFDVASAESKFGWYRPSLLTTLPLENHRRKVPVGFGKKLEVNRGPSRNLRTPRLLKPAQRTLLAKVDDDLLPIMVSGSDDRRCRLRKEYASSGVMVT